MRDTYIDQFTSKWSPEARKDFRQRPMAIRHNYHEHHAFSDMALAELLERHPRDMVDFCTMGEDATDRDSWRAGDPGDLSGVELIDAVRTGKLWINIRGAMNLDALYRPIYDSMMADMKEADKSFRPGTAEAGILISSPRAQVFLHSDISETMLWHMRGIKRFRAYKPALPYLRDIDMESVLLEEQTEDIPYDPDWDADAFTVDLHPGMAANWPLHGPHRIENQSGLNVSVPFEISTPQSRARNGVLFANGILRRKFGWSPKASSPHSIAGLAKRMLTKAFKLHLKLFGRGDKPMPNSEQTFDITPDAPEGFVDRKVA
jgi:hypothetical protein